MTINRKAALLIVMVLLVGMTIAIQPVFAAGTTEVTVQRIADDGSTVLNETTVDVAWMEGNLDVQGDGETHYYAQGPTFVDDLWDLNESINCYDMKDMGAVKGTDVKDLCELAGGASSGDEIKLVASDGFSKTFAYSNVYAPEARQGMMVLTWWKDGSYTNGSYSDGMKNVFFADTSVNEWGAHIFGNYDMNQTFEEKYQHFFPSSGVDYPATTGLYNKYVKRIQILTDDSVPDVDEIFNDSLTLDDTNVTVVSDGGTSYNVSKLTPLGAIQVASEEGTGFTTGIDDFAFGSKGILLLNDIGSYDFVKHVASWDCYVNDVMLDDWANYTTDGLNIKELVDGDIVEFCYYDSPTSVAPIAMVKIIVSTDSGPAIVYEGTLTLDEANVTVESTQGTSYEVSELTPLGALQVASGEGSGFTTAISDKKYGKMGILLVDNISSYPYVKDGSSWVCYVNNVLLNEFDSPDTDGLNNKVLEDEDEVVFCYGVDGVTPATATAKVIIDVATGSGPAVVYDGTLTLDESNVTVESTQGTSYAVSKLTPLGVLQVASGEGSGFTTAISDKSYELKGILLVDNISSYSYEKHVASWCCYVNDVLLDDWSSPSTDGLNIKKLVNGDKVNFCYGDDATIETATAVVKIVVNVDAPAGWELTLKGKLDDTYTQSEFETGVTSKGVSYSDDNGDWKGLPLYDVVGLVDDDDPTTFNTEIAAEGYSIKVISSDGYSINFESSDISESDNYLIANTLNGTALPETIGASDKLCYPLRMVGNDVDAGQLIGGVTTIELIGLPEPVVGWALDINGVVNDTITQAEFEDYGYHRLNWTDPNGDVWSGVPLYIMVGVSDDIETTGSFTFDPAAAAEGYDVQVVASDGFAKSFASADVARNLSYILADSCNGAPLPKTGDKPTYPLRLVGSALWSESGSGLSGASVGAVSTINLIGLIPEPLAGNWDLTLEGAIDACITQTYFEQGIACHHNVQWTDADGNVWSGVPLYDFCGWVDDRTPHGSSGFNRALAEAGYTVIITAGDGYSKELDSSLVLESKDDSASAIIVANKINGSAITDDDKGPVRVVGPGLPSGSYSIGDLAKIQLTDFQKPTEAPTLTIIKIGADKETEVQNITKTYTWMAENLDVYGDGSTDYKFEACCYPATGPDPWDVNETYPGGVKISDPIKGTSIKDLCELVGGMPEGTEITFIASDGWTSKISRDVIYNDPAETPRLGTPVLAWYGNAGSGSGPMPDYSEGFRIFFVTEDHIFGQWDMHETIPAEYWHYNQGVPSCAGLSAKYISKIVVQTTPDPSWTLNLSGAIDATITKGFFEGALGCTMAQGEESHEVLYTDAFGKWTGMPLWLLCGFVDDGNSHTGKSYNETLAEEGYTILVKGEGGSSVAIDSRDTIKSSNYIIANELGGKLLVPGDGRWSLKLVGENVSASEAIGNITEIELVFGSGDMMSLSSGWNFVSVPKRLADGAGTAAIFSDVNTDGHPIYRYAASNKMWQTLSATSAIVPLDAYWIYSKGNTNVPMNFSENPVATPSMKYIYEGWNGVGLANTQFASAHQMLFNVQDIWTYLQGFDADDQKYETTIIKGEESGTYSENRLCYPYSGYWVLVKSNGIMYALSA